MIIKTIEKMQLACHLGFENQDALQASIGKMKTDLPSVTISGRALHSSRMLLSSFIIASGWLSKLFGHLRGQSWQHLFMAALMVFSLRDKLLETHKTRDYKNIGASITIEYARIF